MNQQPVYKGLAVRENPSLSYNPMMIRPDMRNQTPLLVNLPHHTLLQLGKKLVEVFLDLLPFEFVGLAHGSLPMGNYCRTTPIISSQNCRVLNMQHEPRTQIFCRR